MFYVLADGGKICLKNIFKRETLLYAHIVDMNLQYIIFGFGYLDLICLINGVITSVPIVELGVGWKDLRSNEQ
jgi:hypothetical protein